MHNSISGVKVRMLASNAVYRGFEPRMLQIVDSSLECCRSWIRASNAVDRGFEPRMLQIVDSNHDRVKLMTKIGICCFFANHTALRRKSKDWLARNQDNVSECQQTVISMSQHYKNPTKRVGLVQSEPHYHLIENQLILAMIQPKNCNNHSLTHSATI